MGRIRMKKVEKKSLNYRSRNPSLTNTEKEVLHLITDEFLTIKQMAQRRGVTIQAIYKIVKQLKKKGAYDGGLNRVENKVEKAESTYKTDIRLHGQEFNIKIVWQDNKYQKSLEKSNTLFLESNTMRLYKNAIEIYSGQSFFGKTTNEADKKSFDYWERFFARLEHELNIIIKKQRSRNIKEVNHHYARGNSEICENAEENKERIWVYAEEDGKLAFITDDSFGFKEDECVHPTTAKQDRDAVDKQVNDWRINNPPTNSQLAINLNGVIGTVGTLASTIGEYGIHIKSHTSAIIKLEKGINKLTKFVGKTVRENKKLKMGTQKTLKDFK